MRHQRVLPILLAAVAAFLAACAGNSSASSGEPSLIRIEIVQQEGPPIKGLVEDGSFLLLKDGKGRALAFKPDVHTRPAKIQVFEIEPGAQGGTETMRLVDETDVKIGAAEAKPVAKIYSVRILEVIPET